MRPPKPADVHASKQRHLLAQQAREERNAFRQFSYCPSPTHQRRLRTSNVLERVNLELKRRTRVASLFPNEASRLRLISALLGEISEEWITSKIDLKMNPADLPLNSFLTFTE